MNGLKRNGIGFVVLLLGSMLSLNAQTTKFKKVKPYEGIKMSIPQDFVEMSESDMAQRYVTSKKPTMVYTNSNMEVDMDVNLTKNFWNSSDFNLLKDFYKSSIYNSHKRVEFIKEEVVEINKRKYVWLEYKSAFAQRGGSLKKQFTVILFTIVQDRILVFSFRCPQRRMEQWQEISHTAMNSIKVSKKLQVEQLVEKEVKGEELKERKTEESEKDKRPDQKVSPRPNFKKPEIDPEQRKKEEKKGSNQ